MNIRARLRVSNLLMIVVPVVAVLATAAVAAAVAWFALGRGSGVGVDGNDDFSHLADVAFGIAEPLVESGSLDRLAQAASLSDVLERSGFSFVVARDGAWLYSYGEPAAEDRALMADMASMGHDVDLSRDGRCLSMRVVDANGSIYRLYLMGEVSSRVGAATESAASLLVVALAAVLVATVFASNRFLSLFVLRHVTGPLDELAHGARQIRDGDLAFLLPEGRTDEFAPVFSDFNDMARRLSASVERDRAAEEERRTLLVGLSHDLRSPLTSIQAYTEGLLDGIARTPADRERYLRMILRKTEDLRGLLGKVSGVAKMGAEVLPADLQPLDLDDLVRSWADENGRAYALRGVELEVRADPAHARIDGDFAARVLANLLDNCATHARAGREECRAVLSCGAGDGTAWLAVDDDGPGASAEALPHLFDLFWRGDAARRAPEEGNGIGLAVVARAALEMGGEARALPSELGGLRVELRFPACGAGGGSGRGTDGSPEGAVPIGADAPASKADESTDEDGGRP